MIKKNVTFFVSFFLLFLLCVLHNDTWLGAQESPPEALSPAEVLEQEVLAARQDIGQADVPQEAPVPPATAEPTVSAQPTPVSSQNLNASPGSATASQNQEQPVHSLNTQGECLTCNLTDKPAKPELERVSATSKRFASLQGSGERMTIDFKESEMDKVFRLFSEWAKINIILDPKLKDVMVTLHLKDVTLSEALDVVFNSYGLKHAEIGDCIFVSSAEQINSMDALTKTVRLRNVNAKNVEKLLKDVIRSSVADEELNTIVITGAPSQIAEAEAIIRNADNPQRQVLLTTQVLEIDRNSTKETGIDWNDSTAITFQETQRPGTIAAGTTLTNAGNPFQIYRLGRSALNFEMTVKHLIETGKAKVLANPKISTVVGKEAHIFIGDRVPYEITTISGGATTTEVRFTEAGVKLALTPSIIEEDYVVVTVAPEVSVISGWRGDNQQYPEVKTREAQASMRIKNNETFVLGGLLSEYETISIRKVPFLHKIPLLGSLFKSETRETDHKEIIITVTPQIVSN